MPDFKQAGRLMQLATVLAPDLLLIDSLEGVEGLSRLFDYQAEVLVAAGTDVDAGGIVGTNATVAIALLDVQGTRFVNGLVAAFEQTAGDDNFDVYRLHIVPSLWQLTLSANCRVFQGKTLMEVIKAVIEPYCLSLGDVTESTYPAMDYCTQYNETDFAFISRLMEEFGVFYWFEHSDGDNKVMFGDSTGAYKACPDVATVQYSAQKQDKEAMYHSVVNDLRVTATMISGKYSTRSWDHKAFTVDNQGPLPSAQPTGKNAYERYSYPGGDAGYVKERTKMLDDAGYAKHFLFPLMQAPDVGGSVYHGASTARTFLPGFTFDLTDHTRTAWNQNYVLLEVGMRAVQSPPYMSDAKAMPAPYSNNFTAMESERLYRAERRTPKPRMPGPQNAVVVTPDGEEQYMDELGRVNIRFFWDRTAGLHKTDNTWVRVAQPWASRGFGTFFWPRLDDEVLVHFVDGDPDDPIVIGSVYNGKATPKYGLPDNSTRSGIVTRSSKGGTADNANELYFEDKKGSEEIYIHAEKDMNTSVEKNSSRKVGVDDSTEVEGNSSTKIKGNQSVTVSGNQSISVSGNRTVSVSGESNQKYSGGHKLSYAGDTHISYGGKLTEKVAGAYGLKAPAHNEKLDNIFNVDAGQEIHLKAGMKVVIESGVGITLKAAGGFINIDPSGVTIQGTMVLINSGGAAMAGTPCSVDDPEEPQTVPTTGGA